MCDAVYGVRCENEETLQIQVRCVKPRDFEPPGPFTIQGRPYIDEDGDFGVLTQPPQPRGQAQLETLAKVIQLNPEITYRDLAEATGISKHRLEKLAVKAGFEKSGKTWSRVRF